MKNTYLIAVCLVLLLGVRTANGQMAKCKGKYFGNILQYSTPSNYNTYWNQVTSENGSKWGSIEGTKGVYNFGNSDLSFNWAKNNSGLFKFHALVWGAQTPGWVANASTATITAGIHDFIKACSAHYAPMGGLTFIDVLNEPVNTPMPGNMKAALTAGYQAEPANAADRNNQYGWAIWCFQLARKYFPDATLLINEYNVEMNWNNCRAPYIAMTNAIKNAPNLTDGRRNLIDGVGLQCHGIGGLTAANFKACIDEIWNKTGVPIHITEFDQTADPNEAKQQAVYSSLIPVAWEHPRVAGITLWGYIQGSTWVGGNKVAGPGGTDTGLLYSSSYGANPLGERPAMTWLKSYLASRPSLSCCPPPASFGSCTGNPTISFTAPTNNSTFPAGSNITLAATASDPGGSISNVKFYNSTTLLSTDNTAPYSFDWTNVAAGTYTIRAVATDDQGNTAETIITIKVNVPQGSYNGTAHAIPGTIQFEAYDVGGNGFAYLDNTPGSAVTPVVNFRTNEDVDIENCTDTGGGYNIGFATAGEWLEYTVNVQTSGTYNMDLRVACSGDDRTLSVAMGSATIASNVAIPNTGGWQTWENVRVSNIDLTAGQHIMRVTIGATDYINMNYVTFALSNNPPTVSITAPANNSTYTTLQTVTLTATASDADGNIASVSFYSGTTLLGTDNTSPYSYTWSGMSAGTHTITAKATDDKGGVTTSAPVTVVVQGVQSPFNGSRHTVPGRIEAEEYDLGGEGLGYHEANTNGNEGGAAFRNDEVDVETTGDADGTYNVGYILEGEWLEYSVKVMETRSYGLDIRVASDGAGKTFHIEIDGVDVTGPVTVPNTGGFQTWATVSVPDINLTAGNRQMRIVFDASYFNLNYVEFNIVTSVDSYGTEAMNIYPNPFNANGLQIRKSGAFKYSITNMQGTLLEEGKGTDEHIIGSDLNPGIYILNFESEGKVAAHKIVKY